MSALNRLEEVARIGGWREHLIPLSLTGVYRPLLSGYAIVYCRDGSTPGPVLQFDFGGGGLLTNVRPGQHFVGRFTGLQVSAAPGNLVASGTARILVLETPHVDYRELPQSIGTGAPSEAADNAQAYNSILNIPTLATDGLSLAGATGVRILVACSDGAGAATKTISGGEVRLWYYSLTDAAWYESETTFTLTTGRNKACTPDLECRVPFGRVFAEIRSFIDSGGSGSPRVRIQAWGA